jgi:hypothetical protein
LKLDDAEAGTENEKQNKFKTKQNKSKTYLKAKQILKQNK